MWLIGLVCAFSAHGRLIIVGMVALVWLASTVAAGAAEAQRTIGFVAEARWNPPVPRTTTFTLNAPPASPRETRGIAFDYFKRELNKLGSDPGLIIRIASTGRGP